MNSAENKERLRELSEWHKDCLQFRIRIYESTTVNIMSGAAVWFNSGAIKKVIKFFRTYLQMFRGERETRRTSSIKSALCSSDNVDNWCGKKSKHAQRWQEPKRTKRDAKVNSFNSWSVRVFLRKQRNRLCVALKVYRLRSFLV